MVVIFMSFSYVGTLNLILSITWNHVAPILSRRLSPQIIGSLPRRTRVVILTTAICLMPFYSIALARWLVTIVSDSLGAAEAIVF
jgi:hypothetical protein